MYCCCCVAYINAIPLYSGVAYMQCATFCTNDAVDSYMFQAAISDGYGDRPVTPAKAEATAAGELSASQIMFDNILVKQLAANIVSGLQEVLRPAPPPLSLPR